MERRYTNHNLAGILCEAFGLASEGGRTDFSGPQREAIRAALDGPLAPATFAELRAALTQGQADERMLAAIDAVARGNERRSLQEFASSYRPGDAPAR